MVAVSGAPHYVCCCAGAGWGGCIIALVPEDKVAAFRQQLMDLYYCPLVGKGAVSAHDLALCVFDSSPSAGASVQRIGPQPAGQQGAAGVAVVGPAVA
jgi:galactokinase